MPDEEPVLLIDLSSIGHPIWHVSQQEPDPDYTSHQTVAVVHRLAADYQYAAICCDSSTSFRKELDPTYKANRPKAEAALHHQIMLAREALAADGYPVWRVDGFEGDDLIATATHRLRKASFVLGDCEAGEQTVLIASADKDLLALVSEHVEVLSTRTGHRLGVAEVKEKLGVEPNQVVDFLTLAGDASDNIKGAKGIGPKGAAWLLGFFGSLDQVYVELDQEVEDTPMSGAQRASLEELRPRLDVVRALVTMRTDVPLDVEEVLRPRVPKVTGTFMEEDEMDEKKTALQRQIDLSTETLEACDHEASPESESEFLARIKDLPDLEASKLSPDWHTLKYGATAESVRASQGWSSDLARQPAGARTAAAVAVVPMPAEEPAPVEWERSLEPRSMDDAVRLAQRLHDSHMFSAYGTPQAVLSTVLLGRELGLPAMAALRSVHVIKGRHSLSAQLMVAIILKSGKADYFRLIESTEMICTYETKRKGRTEPTTHTFTIDDARTAGLLNDNWTKMPKPMLRARCSSELARIEYPDLLAGLYTPEELRDANNGN